MLDKEVIQFTREGLVRKNLSTGKSEVVVQSDYAKEMKYHPAGKEARYQSPHGHPDAKGSGNSGYKIDAKAQCPGSGEQRSNTARCENITSGAKKSGEIPPPGAAKSEKTSSSGGGIAHPYGRHRGNINNSRTAGADGQRAQTPATLGKSTPKRSGAGKQYLFVPNRKIQGQDRKDDNPATQAVKTGVRLVRHRHDKIRKRVFRHFKNRLFQNAVKDEDNPAIQAVGYGIRGTVYAGRGIRKARKIRTGILKHQAVMKFILLAAAIFIGLLLLCLLLGGMTEGLLGSTTDNPDLTNYVEQLDSDFLAKIDSIKADYRKQSNTTVTIEGDESVATDPNALAIVAVGQWTMIDLTQENKQKLADAHAKLNTYTISTKDETETETTTNPDGTSSETKKPIHHVTIQVRVYTALEKLDDFGYTDQQQKDITEQLTVLNEITAGTPENTEGTGTIVGDGTFNWPLSGHTYISSGYGSRVDPITGEAGAFHTGLDIPAPTGTPVLASAAGKVIYSGVKGGYGNCVIIQHANGVQTLYGHNSELDVQKGETVTQGQMIAKVGQTGRATGPHCHFEFRVNGRHVNPAQYIHFKESS